MAKQISVTIDDAVLRKLIRATGGTVRSKVVADGVEYGIYQEYGVENGFGRGVRIPAHPFMRPAAETVQGAFQKAMADAWKSSAKVQAAIDKTARDVEGIAKAKAPVDTGALRSSIHVDDAEGYA